MTNEMKNCQTCGKEFESSRTGSTVNCPDCRAKKNKFKVGEKTYVHRESFHKCKTCDEVFTRGNALRHRKETGHKF